jgi:hypothetical protein
MSDISLDVFAKRDCPTCLLVAPVMRALATRDKNFKVFSQDDPGFHGVSGVVDDRDLEQSFRHHIEIVPTLIRFESGREVARIEGWDVKARRRISGVADLGQDLPVFLPGCGSKSGEPGPAQLLAIARQARSCTIVPDIDFGAGSVSERSCDVSGVASDKWSYV